MDSKGVLHKRNSSTLPTKLLPNFILEPLSQLLLLTNTLADIDSWNKVLSLSDCLIFNSNKIRYKKNYIQLEDVYSDYFSQTGFTSYHFIDSYEFVDRISPYWAQLLEQIIPSTTLWTGGNLIENNIFGRSKYRYRFGCQPKVFVESLYL